MKRILIAISFLAIAATSFAGNPERNLTPERMLDASIQNQIAFPNFLTEEPSGVYAADIHFKVNANGSIAVTEILADNGELKANLTRQIKSILVNTAGLDLNETYKITFRFKITSETESN